MIDAVPEVHCRVIDEKRSGSPPTERRAYVDVSLPGLPGIHCRVWCYEDEPGCPSEHTTDGDSVVLTHEIGSATMVSRFEPAPGAVDIRVSIVGLAKDQALPFEYLNPCVQYRLSPLFQNVGTYVDEFVSRCFVFLEGGQTRLSDTRRIPGTRPAENDLANADRPWIQEYVPAWREHPGQIAGERGYSPDRPTCPIIGVVSHDQRYLSAVAWPETKRLGQVWVDCIHPRPDVLESLDESTGEIHSRGRIYFVANDGAKLLAAFERDFPRWR